ncbi:MAG: family 43 glycosylhydrolase [Oscillospiraceae bacterium]|nr:family 43 glycosylhydrolase [Oscillospiraceae bacterium]
MKKKRLISALTASACMFSMLTSLPNLIQAVPASAATTVANPFIYSDVPDDDIIRVDDTYYMVSTTMFFSPGAPIMKSKDLFSWEMCGYVFDKYADGDVQNLRNGKHDYSHGQWATSLRYHDGMFYVFFGSYGSGKSYIYKTTDIESGDWTRVELNGMYHDASMLFDDDGRNYLVYGGGGEIKIKEFNSEMTNFKQGGLDKTLFKTNLTGLAGEGSHIHKINGWYYVFVIAWPNGKPRIELCYRSKSLTGNFEGKEILNSGLGTYGSGVAQGGIVDTPDGDWYGLMFQDHGAVGRVPVLVPCTWQNDWPILGVNGKAPTTLQGPDEYKGAVLAKSDEFDYDSNNLMLEWQWNHNPDDKSWSVTENPGYLRLHNATIANNIIWARNTLTMRTEGPSCKSSIKLDTSGMKPGDYAGLSAFQLNFGNVGVYVADDGSRKVYMAKNGGNDIGNSSNKIVAQENLDGKEVYLKVEFTFATVDGNYNVSNNIDRANFFYSTDGNNWKKIGDTLGMTYDLKMFTGYRSAIYSYPTKTTGGYADIDYFEYERADFNTPNAAFEPEEPDPDGYIFHYTFEKNGEGFSGRGSASVSTSTAEKYAGEKSLACTGREASWNGAAHSLSSAKFKAGESYSFSADVLYTEGEPTDKFHFTLQYTDASGEVAYEKIATETLTKGEWGQLKNTSFQIPEGATNMTIYVETDESTSSFYVDEVIAAEAGREIDGPAPAKVEVKFTRGDLNEDGVINAVDMTLAKRGLLTEKFGSEAEKLAADVNGDGSVTVADIVWYVKYLTGQVTDFDLAANTEPKDD